MLDKLERSVLIVPASNWSMLQKAALTKADAICLDLEDSVLANDKEIGRANIIKSYRELDFGTKLKMFRINSLDTHFAYRDIIEVIESVGDVIDIIVIPKVSNPKDIYVIETLLEQIETNKNYKNKIGIEVLIETALGCLHIKDIVSSSSRLEGLIYGSGDYAASVQMPMISIGEMDINDQNYPGHRWHYIMQTIICAARSYGKRAIDGPFAGIRDQAGLVKSCNIGRSMGFDGKWCIHPNQLSSVNEIFSPSEQDINWAMMVLEEYEISRQTKNRGAISVKGKMVDAASIKLCRSVIKKAKLAGLIS